MQIVAVLRGLSRETGSPPHIFSYQFGNIRRLFFRCSKVIGYNHR